MMSFPVPKNIYLEVLGTAIVNSDSKFLFDFDKTFLELEFEKSEILNFLLNLNSLKQEKIQKAKPIISISGSGGSNFPRPNLSSLTCLYLAADGRNWVLKTGSRARTGQHGSTDFFCSLFYKYNVNLEDSLKEFNFAYFDVDDAVPWKKFSQYLKRNRSFNDFFSNYVIHDFKYDLKFTGMLGYEPALQYFNKTHIDSPTKLICVWSKIGNMFIDEILLSDVYSVDMKAPEFQTMLYLIHNYNPIKINIKEVSKVFVETQIKEYRIVGQIDNIPFNCFLTAKSDINQRYLLNDFEIPPVNHLEVYPNMLNSLLNSTPTTTLTHLDEVLKTTKLHLETIEKAGI